MTEPEAAKAMTSISKEKTILAASDVEPFYSGHRERSLSTSDSVSRELKAYENDDKLALRTGITTNTYYTEFNEH